MLEPSPDRKSLIVGLQTRQTCVVASSIDKLIAILCAYIFRRALSSHVKLQTAQNINFSLSQLWLASQGKITFSVVVVFSKAPGEEMARLYISTQAETVHVFHRFSLLRLTEKSTN